MRPSIRGALRVVAWAAPLVPASIRASWRREWEAEIAAYAEEAPARGHRGPSVLRRSLGAPVDAFWIRQRSIADGAWVDDLRHASRQLRRHAGFAVAAVGILALGMAGCLTAFSVVSQMLMRPLPYPDPDRVVTLWERHAAAPGRDDVAPGNFLDWRAQAGSFSHLAGGEPYSYDYTGGERPEVVRSVNVTEGFFEAFGLPPLHGRYFLPGEHAKGANRVVVLSARMWRTRFNGDPGIVGRSIPLDGAAYVVVGVAPDSFEPNLLEDVPGETGLWAAKAVEEYEGRIRGGGYWQVVGRLAPGHTLASAQAEMDAIAQRLESEHPRTNTGSRVEVATLREHLVGDVRPAVALFTAAVLAVLLIACVNVTNLLLARGTARTHELGIRAALGARRGRLVVQLLVESLLIATVASAAAVVLAMGATRMVALTGPREVLWIDSLHVDGQALVFAVVLTFVVALGAGLVPAWRLSNTGTFATANRTSTADRSHRRLRAALVAAEVALALMLVSGCALLVRSFVNLINVDTGFRREGIAALQVFAWDRNQSPAARRLFFERVLSRIGGLAGVEETGAVSAMPFIESNIDVRGVITLPSRPTPAPGEEPRSSFNVATPGYFRVMRIPLRKGRHLDERDGPDSARVAVISDALASRLWPDTDPIGDRLAFRYNGQPTEVTVVGVVGSTRHERLDEEPRTELFLPHAQAPTGSMTLVVRTRFDPRMAIEPAKAEVWAEDSLQTFYRTATLDELVGRTLTTRRFALLVLTGFSVLALLLAAVGLYSVLSAIASQYRREIGVRMAIGASWLDIVRLIVTRGLTVAAAGVAIGLVGVAGTARVLEAFLFSVTPQDPAAIGGAAVLMLAVAGVACYVPARRAAQVDPVEALRVE